MHTQIHNRNKIYKITLLPQITFPSNKSTLLPQITFMNTTPAIDGLQ
jgi:hypothetical protein